MNFMFRKKVQIPRGLQEKKQIVDTASLHTFVDAFERAYGIILYCKNSYQDCSISTNIVAAKIKVATCKATNIPRLEIMGAVIGDRLTKRILTVLEIYQSVELFSEQTA